MAAYTWTPSRNSPARIPPVPCVLNKALLLGDIAGPTLFSVIGTPPRKGGTWRGSPPKCPHTGEENGNPHPFSGWESGFFGGRGPDPSPVALLVAAPPLFSCNKASECSPPPQRTFVVEILIVCRRDTKCMRELAQIEVRSPFERVS